MSCRTGDGDKELLKGVKQAIKGGSVLALPSTASSTATATANAVEVPIPERGVSLAWLTALAAVLEKAGVSDDASTAYVVTRLLLPLCKQSAPPPPSASSSDCNAISIGAPQASGASTSQPGSPRTLLPQRSTNARSCDGSGGGASVSLGSPRASSHLKPPGSQSPSNRQGGGASPRDPSSGQRELVSVPSTLGKGGVARRAALLGGAPPPRRGSRDDSGSGVEPSASACTSPQGASAMQGVESSARSAPNLNPMLRRSMAKQLTLWETLPGAVCSKPQHYVVHAWGACFFHLVRHLARKLNPPAVPNQPPPPFVDPAQTFLWLDFVAIPPSEVLGQSLDVEVVKEAITACKGGTLVVLDEDLIVLGRTWCLMEVFLSKKVELVLPEHLDIELAWRVQTKLSTLDIAHTETSRPEDKLCLVREVKAHVGAKRMAQVVCDTLTKMTRATLRWGNVEYVAGYIALLLKGNELALLGTVLTSMPELYTDEKTLAEMSAIFKMYDSDGSGELDADEFIQVLDAAGFAEDEARKIYDQVNADGGDGVGLEEFEAWWVESQRQQFMATRRTMTEVHFDELLKLLEEFIKTLERNELEEHVDYFQDWLQKLRASPKGKLALPPTKGDLVELADSISWKMHSSENSMAVANALYNFLSNNADGLDSNLAAIPRAETLAGCDPVEVQKAVLAYLHLLQGLLRWYPAKQHHAQHFLNMAEAIEAKLKHDDPVINKKKKKKMKMLDMHSQMHGVISNMVHLKYGDDRAMNSALIQEAGSALGRWMASNREGTQRMKAGTGGVSSLTQAYLGMTDGQGRPRGPSSQSGAGRGGFLPACPSMPSAGGGAGSSRSFGGAANCLKLPNIARAAD